MKIETTYALDDVVYYPLIQEKKKRVPCKTCKGTGHVEASYNGGTISARCPDCSHGYMERTQDSYGIVILELCIKKIDVSITSDGLVEQYLARKEGGYYLTNGTSDAWKLHSTSFDECHAKVTDWFKNKTGRDYPAQIKMVNYCSNLDWGNTLLGHLGTGVYTVPFYGAE